MWNRRLNLNQHGNTMIQALVATALLGGTALGFSSLFKDSFEFSNRIQRTVDLTQKFSEINMILSSSHACTTSLSGQILTENGAVAMKDPTGKKDFLALGKNSIKGSDVQKVTFVEIAIDSVDNTTAMATLRLEYLAGADKNLRQKDFLVSVRRDPATSRITSCISNESYVRGGVYGNCAMEFGPDFNTLKASAPVWPVVKCENPTICANGFSPVTLSFSQGNTTPSGAMNPARDYYWGQTACVKD